MYITEQIDDNGLKLSYRFYSGNKKRTLFLFHGFAQSSAVFDAFATSLLPHYSVISVDLFFHGESMVETNEAQSVSIDRWAVLFERVLAKHQIDRFSLLSYSMGSRFIVSLLTTYAPRIDKITLIAPDGFGNNFWFRAATSNACARFIFKCTMHNPAWVLVMVRALAALGIFNSVTKRFIERNLESRDHRKNIYRSWVYFRKLKISSDTFVKLIRTNEIDLICFCGKEDQLVAKDAMQVICGQASACYIELDLAHHKMLQALEMAELNSFLIFDR